MSANLRPELPPLPPRFAALPIDPVRGYPVPWFVAWVDGKPDFRIIDDRKRYTAVAEARCWLCGERMGAYKTFVIGPMCAINRISSEPPSHLDCADFAARACPFLVRPHAQRREGNLPEDHQEAPGNSIKRNPGVSLVWTTRAYSIVRADQSWLINVGEPSSVKWYREGRAATREEVLESVRTGYPELLKIAAAQGVAAINELESRRAAAEKHYPTALVAAP